MQPLSGTRISPTSAHECAGDLLAGIPAVMRFIRHEMRSNRQSELTVPQFRVLVFLSIQPECSLSLVAEHVGLSLPAASRMVDLLVNRRLVKRQVRVNDRRAVALSLTRKGQDTFRAALKATQSAMAKQFEGLSARDRAVVSSSMAILQLVFSGPVNGAKS